MVFKTKYTLAELIQLDPEVRAFLYTSGKGQDKEFFDLWGRMLGTMFYMDDIKKWSAKSEGGANSNTIFMPLVLSLRPELREVLIKMSSGLVLPSEYNVKKGEVVVDLGQVSKDEFMHFLQHRKMPEGWQPGSNG